MDAKKELLLDLQDLKTDQSEIDSLTKLKLLLRQDEQLGRFCFDDWFLIKFLRCRDNDPQRAYENVLAYGRAIQNKPDLFKFTDQTASVLRSELHLISKSKTEKGEGVIILRPHRWNYKEVPFDELFRLMFYNCELALLDPELQKNGFHSIIDCSNLSLSLIYNCGPTNAAYMSEITEVILPAKVIRIHLVNQSRLVDFAYNLFRPFLHQSFKEKLHFHGKSFGDLYTYCPRSTLPEFLGGTLTDHTPEQRLALYDANKFAWEKYWNLFKSIKADE